jgi:hypothetical protein
MSATPHKIPFAVHSDGTVRSVHEVDRGLACNCICPACEAQLKANQGEVVRWYFSHASGTSCSGALESSLHLAVKAVILKERQLLVPPCSVLRYPDFDQQHSRSTADGEYVLHPYRYSCKPYRYTEELRRIGGGFGRHPSRPKLIRFDEVHEEVRDGDIQPDLIGVTQGHRLYIEVAVTHPIDSGKLRKIRANGVAAIQISVTYNPEVGLNWDQIRTLVLEQTDGKAWAYNPVVEAKADRDFEAKAPFRLRQKDEAEAEAQRRRELQELDAQIAFEEAEEARLKAEEDSIQHKKDEAERLVRLAEEDRQYRERRSAREAAEAKEKARLLKLEEERELAAQAVYNALLERVRTEKPSDKYPLLQGCPVLFIDLDTLLKTGGIGILGRALGHSLCNLVITSEVRYSTPTADILANLLPLGGRPVSFTPILSESNEYGIRAKEIEAWFKHHDTEQRLDIYLIVDQGWFNLKHPHIVLGSVGFTEIEANLIKSPWARRRTW